MSVEVKINGLKELSKALNELPGRVARNIIGTALRAGGNVIKNQAKANLPENYTTLRKSLVVVVGKQRDPYTRSAIIGPTVGKRAKYDGWYAHIVEGGALPHEIPARFKKVEARDGQIFGSLVHHPGVHAKPFMRPAFESTKQKVVDAMAEKIRARIEIEAAKK